MELAVNIPLQEPQVGHAARSTAVIRSSPTSGSAAITMASTRSYAFPPVSPASMGPPETNTAGMLSRMAAISIPGVILSQFEMHTMASTVWALHMNSTLSAIRSREGSE